MLQVLTKISKDGPSREKALRATGSLFKSLYYYINESNPDSSLAIPFKSLATTISEARRVYRQCKYIECFSSLLRTFQHKNPVLRVLQSGRYMALMMHHTFDQIVFLQAMGVLRDSIWEEKLVELKKKTLAAWWISIWFQLAGDFYIYYCDWKLSQAYQQEIEPKKKLQLKEKLQQRKKAHLRLAVDILKNVFDFPCAMEGALKRGTLHNGQIGCLAVISSLFGLYLAYPTK